VVSVPIGAGARVGQRRAAGGSGERVVGQQHSAAAEQLVAGPAEQLLGAVVDQHDAAAVHDQDRVRGGLQQAADNSSDHSTLHPRDRGYGKNGRKGKTV
jgi:hypothetical protein